MENYSCLISSVKLWEKNEIFFDNITEELVFSNGNAHFIQHYVTNNLLESIWLKEDLNLWMRAEPGGNSDNNKMALPTRI